MKSLLDKSTLMGAALLIGLGLLVGFVGNLTAGPTRHLEWGRDYPPKGKPNCPETLPEPGGAPISMADPAGGATADPAPVAAPSVASDQAALPGTPEPLPEAPAEAAQPPADSTSAAVTPAPQLAAGAAPAPAPVTPVPAAPPAPAVADVPPVPEGKPWLEINPAQVDALAARGAVFVDARMTSQYQEGHIAGAIAIPIWESGVDQKIAQLVFEAEGDMARPIIVYCNGGDCEDSHNLGEKIFFAGHQSVYVYKDGYPDWLQRGRPVATGDAR